MKRMLDREIPDNYRFYVGEAAQEIGMPRRSFLNYLSPSAKAGMCQYTIPLHGKKKIIYGKWLKRFYYHRMGFDLPH